MPSPRRSLRPHHVAELSDALFAATGPDLVGVELEWPLHRAGDVTARPRYADLAALDGAVLDAGSRITIEPGGQVELSTAPFSGVAEALRAARIDGADLFGRLDPARLVPQTLAVDDRRAPQRILDKPRYVAMEAFFRGGGDAGAEMMTNTSSTQVNLGHAAADPAGRWEVLHRISPILIAAFSNSPGVDRVGNRWACLRQAIWWAIDPTRTRPVPPAADPARAWTEYALRARVMFIGGSAERCDDVVADPGLTFGQWLTDGHELGWPTDEDLRTHLSTLFPPVRPRGWLELRVLDALPDWIREVAVLCVLTAAQDDVRRELTRRLPGTGGLWLGAIRDGLADPCLAGLARTFLDVVVANVESVTDESDHLAAVREYRERYVMRGRSPGDDLPRSYDLRARELLAIGAA